MLSHRCGHKSSGNSPWITNGINKGDRQIIQSVFNFLSNRTSLKRPPIFRWNLNLVFGKLAFSNAHSRGKILKRDEKIFTLPIFSDYQLFKPHCSWFLTFLLFCVRVSRSAQVCTGNFYLLQLFRTTFLTSL